MLYEKVIYEKINSSFDSMLQGRDCASISTTKPMKQFSMNVKQQPMKHSKKSLPNSQLNFGIFLITSMLISLGVMMSLLVIPLNSDSIVQKFVESADLEGKNTNEKTRTGSFILHGYVYNESGSETVVSEVWITNMRTGDTLKVTTDSNGYYEIDIGNMMGEMRGLRNEDTLRVNTTLGIFVAENYTKCEPSTSERVVNLTLSLPSLVPEFESFAIPLASVPILYFIITIKLKANRLEDKKKS